MWDRFTMWWTMRISIPIGAIWLAYHTLNEEIKGQENAQRNDTVPGMLDVPSDTSPTVPDRVPEGIAA